MGISIPLRLRKLSKRCRGDLKATILFYREFLSLRSLSGAKPRFPLCWKERYPCLQDREGVSGFDRHYFYHLGWAARVLAETMPSVHVDISSNLHFCSTVSAFIPIKFYEYHPPEAKISNLSVDQADLSALPFEDSSLESISCMHVVEHVGLGRYGDKLDPDGDMKAIEELKRVIAPGGQLLFVVPIGRPRLQFNAHRIYSYDQIISYFSGLELKEFALIPDNPSQGGLVRNATKAMADQQRYGCGCFWLVRG